MKTGEFVTDAVALQMSILCGMYAQISENAVGHTNSVEDLEIQA